MSQMGGRRRAKELSGLGNIRILIVDDNPQMRTIVGTVLSGAGVRNLHYATTGKEGLSRLRDLDIDVVFVDYEMPAMNGLDLIAGARKLAGEKRFTPIIMLTGHSDMIRLSAALNLGVNEFLAKPVTARNVLKRLEAVIFHPRDFIETATYFGPDRRRRPASPQYAGPLRRRADHPMSIAI